MPKRTPSGGFTLIEVLVALVIAVFAFVALFGALRDGMMGTERAETVTRAVLWAESLLAEAKAVPPRDSRSGKTPDGYNWTIRVAPPPPVAGIRWSAPTFNRRGAPTLEARDIRVEVSWHENGRMRSVALTGLALVVSAKKGAEP